MVCLGRSGRNRTCDPLIPNQVPFRLATLRFIFSGGVIGTRTQKGVTPDRLAICSNTNYGITPLLAEDRRHLPKNPPIFQKTFILTVRASMWVKAKVYSIDLV